METQFQGRKITAWDHSDCDPENCQCESWDKYYKSEKAFQARQERIKGELTFALQTTLPGIRKLIDREEMEVSELARILRSTLGNNICFDLIEFIEY